MTKDLDNLSSLIHVGFIGYKKAKLIIAYNPSIHLHGLCFSQCSPRYSGAELSRCANFPTLLQKVAVN